MLISNRKKKGEGNVENGNKYLAWAFVEAANLVLLLGSQALLRAQESIVATKALAHKLARACYHILKEGKPFDVTPRFA
ncbi:hypothetical protein [Bradyrhizobium sp. Gha]|uniref:hypothetical protein n=1 Tax=Bradyrhizobium sp. Gha TaxID=1855318 RepID=UPI001AECE256|nr:hypothetical protein [Bradyrhizobium sp. Gha]